MDPALQEQLDGGPDDLVEVVIRLKNADFIPSGFIVVARFGNILTGRVLRKDIETLWSSPEVASVKASRMFLHDSLEEEEYEVDIGEMSSSFSMLPGSPFTGKGIYFGSADWGIDFTHPNFLNEDGSSRIIYLWDQTGAFDPENNSYGYGRIFSKNQIDAALKTENPFETLGYHPGRMDLFGVGSHGTHVMDIAAGNGRIGNQGMAPEAMILAVHLGSDRENPQHSIGNSVKLLEGIHFLDRMAGAVPLIINLSLGKHGGPHTGTTLVEQALDGLSEGPHLRIISQSAGNYFRSATHTSGRLLSHELKIIRWKFPEKIIGHHEIEFWYSGKDSFVVSFTDVLGNQTEKVFPGSKSDVRSEPEGLLMGRIYNRKLDPNTGFNHIHIFIYKPEPSSIIRILLEGDDIEEGWYHGWIERVVACGKCQSVFDLHSVDPSFTTGSICNGKNTISVGAYDDHDPSLPLGFFSSAGPTLDLRTKPQCIAPGVKILAAKSSLYTDRRSPGKLTYKSGTSMASPFVAGACVLIAEALQGATGNEIKGLLKKMLTGYTDPEFSRRDRFRSGEGILIRNAIWQILNDFKKDFSPSENISNEQISQEADEPVLNIDEIELDEQLDEAHTENMNEESYDFDFNKCNMENINIGSDDSPGDKLSRRLENLEVMIEDKADKFIEKVKGWLRSQRLDGSLFQKLRQAIVPGAEQEDVQVIGVPGQPLIEPVIEGDILLRLAPGEAVPLHACVIADRNYISPVSGNFSGRYRMESCLPGSYVNVIEGKPFPVTRSDGFARRLLDADGLLPLHQMIVRPKKYFDDESESLLTSDEKNIDYIKWAQNALNQVQHSNLKVDGIAGPRTRAAIRTFQVSHSLVPDGVVGPKTEASLVAAGAPPYIPANPPGTLVIPDNIKVLLDQALTSLGAAMINAGSLQASGSFDYTIDGPSFKMYFARYDNAIIFYRTDSSKVVEVHGPLYQEYLARGFDPSAMSVSKLGLPLSSETSWVTPKNTNLGRSQLFDSGKLYWRRKDNKVLGQCLIPKDNLFWGIDATESYTRLVQSGHLITITGYIPCFLGQYLPRSPKSGLSGFAANVHKAFQESFGLTKILLIDNRGTVDTGTRNGKDNGKADALDACLRAELSMDAYMQIDVVKNAAPSITLPESLVIYRDIEPEFHVDQDYIEGFIEGFKEYNNGLPIIKFNPGIYMSFHPTFRPFNAQNIDNLPDKNIRLWAQHPNIPSLTEANFIRHGFKPFSPKTVSCDLWQFNNGDRRFVTGKNFWIDHDMATVAAFNGFWQGDQELYTV